MSTPLTDWPPIRSKAEMAILTEDALQWMGNTMQCMGNLVGVSFQMCTYSGMTAGAAVKLIEVEAPYNFDAEDRQQLRTSAEMVKKTIVDVEDMLRVSRGALHHLETTLDHYDQLEADCVLVEFE